MNEAKRSTRRDKECRQSQHLRPELTMPQVISNTFTRLRLRERVRVLRCLLVPVGPMALLVLAGGAFARYAGQARWPRMSLSVGDAASITSAQILELVRYDEQSKPLALQQAMGIIARDARRRLRPHRLEEV